MAHSIRTADVCVVDFNTLLQGGDCGTLIEDAFGPNGLGILAVANVPGLEERRQTCLPLAFKVANMDEQAKKKYELGEAYYAFGWSHGKESLQGKPDYSKGSYYNNPRFNQPTDDTNLMAKFPTMYHPNIWPHDEVPELERAFMELGQLIIDTGLLIASECDKYVQSKCPTYEAGKLHNRITNSRVPCGRLLHYFALDPNQVQKASTDQVTEADFSNWCGWHNDHSALTGLVQALFTDMQGKTIENPDPNAGLYIKSRSGEIVKAVIPKGHLVFQIGETAQVLTGGILQATPHAVRGPQVPGVNRETLAVFMSVEHDEPMRVPDTMNPEAAGQTTHLPKGVPSLLSRWNNSMLFHEFTAETHKAYYDLQVQQ
ncbi:unnamed protein product [Aphanomyces euteiches]|uniref:Isopenicillin N synthase-like Fe(2+) 2OG dioxygenase domain-containing protein n=1 Tax=Aphanomyces euteiches TaxID=100861 RepID=A0A6G0X1V6_9STRA|nr:hypothetical protein Ae201684_009428 [Aphanomyces euteiches]KAH9070099.1 hypothetical protein Ae201684P_002469 [Aphanomyces euteiches]KAH9140872.1 hypothetical protein AeRB84_014911 [Aphanomyces euteiches]